MIVTFSIGRRFPQARWRNDMSTIDMIEQKNKYLDDVALFLMKHVPDYAELPADSIHALEYIWIAIGDNRMEFISILNNLRKTRKKSVASES